MLFYIHWVNVMPSVYLTNVVVLWMTTLYCLHVCLKCPVDNPWIVVSYKQIHGLSGVEMQVFVTVLKDY